MDLTRRNLVAIASLALALMLPCGSAFAAPPSEPPGNSGDAPGHQKDKDNGTSEQQTPPGHVEPDAVAPDVVVAAVVAQPAEPEAKEHAAESPRFSNAAGKPKHNVPAAAEAAPEASVSAPGNSGRHKLTICHKGHAITVDVHAARAHVDGHGDTYALAGAKGRAACPHSSGPTPQNETPSGPGAVRPDIPAVVAEAGRRTNDPGVAPSVAEDPATAPVGGVSEAAYEQRGGVGGVASAVAGASAGGSLPFTGAPLWLLVLFGLGLVAGGLLLRLDAPARARRRANVRSF
jgi:hypothetical protein